MQDIKFVSFNVNGLGNPIKRGKVLSKLKKDKVQIAYLQETHLGEVEHSKLAKKGGFNHIFSSSYNQGPRRGVAILISRTISYEHISEIKDKKGRFVMVICRIEGVLMTLLNLYAPPGSEWPFYKRIFDLMVTQSQGIMVCAGDLNQRLQPHLDASAGDMEPKPLARKINLLMNEVGIVDVWRELHPSSRDYSYYSAPHTLYARLDYYLIFNRDLHNIKYCSIGPIDLSDHGPVYMTMNNVRKPRSTLWRLNSSIMKNKVTVKNMKRDIKYFLEINDNGEVTPVILWDTLKACVRGNIIALTSLTKKLRIKRVQDLEARLKHLQREHGNSLDTEVKREMGVLKGELDEIATQEIKKSLLFTRQRYYEAGGKSMRLLAYRLRKQQADSTIHRIRNPVTGQMENSVEKIKESFNNYYKELYSQPKNIDETKIEMLLSSLDLPSVSDGQNRDLMAEITIEEVGFAISRLKTGKAAGPDGFTAEFYKGLRDTLAPLLMKTFNWVLQTKETPPSWKDAVITVIPKEGKDKTECGNYRPISLLNLDYKLFTSILTQRLDPIWPILIRNDQAGFIRQRQTQDNIKRTLHIISHITQSGQQAALISCDARKAYDTVYWCFLFKSLEKFGFHESFIGTLQALYKDPNARIKINGDLSDPFILERGVRQGDCISCGLFAAFIEPLSQMIRQNPNIKGINMADGEHKLAFFADDLLSYADQPTKTVPALMETLEEFGALSGYRLNVDKTQVISLNYTPPPDLVRKYDLKWDSESIRYLGIVLPKDISKLRELNYDPLVEQIKLDVARWSLLPFLSLSSRIDTLKMNILPRLLYLFQSIPVEVPRTQFKEWDKMLSKFIWQNKRPRVRYKTLQLNRDLGGLGVPCLYDYYCAAQLRPLVYWFDTSYTARWKDIEQTLIPGIPLAAVIGDENLIKKIQGKNNPWVNISLKIWLEIIKKFVLGKGVKMLKWCAYDTNFIPNTTDSRFQDWIKKGITYHYTLIQGGTLKSFEILQRRNGLEKSDLFRYFQLRHYINQEMNDVMHLGSSGILGTFLSANNPTNGGIISGLYCGLQHKDFEGSAYVMDRWMEEGEFNMTLEEWEIICSKICETSCSKYWREFQWKNHIRYFISPVQQKYREAGSECWRLCEHGVANHFHIFWGCPALSTYWKDIHKHLEAVMGFEIPFRFDVMYLCNLPYGELENNDTKLILILIVASKKAITRKWLQQHSPTVNDWLGVVKDIYNMEKLTYLVRDQKKKFKRIWSKWTDYVDSSASGISWLDIESG